MEYCQSWIVKINQTQAMRSGINSVTRHQREEGGRQEHCCGKAALSSKLAAMKRYNAHARNTHGWRSTRGLFFARTQ